MRVGALVASLVFLLTLFISLRSIEPPAPLAEDVSSDAFSALRARKTLDRVIGDLGPHPIGSVADATARRRIADELRAMGFDPHEETSLVCTGSRCGRVTNVVGRLAGTSPRGRALLLASHHDSVGASPGYSDDGLGMATMLETARVLTSTKERSGDVIALFTDGEEAGLWGAEAFVSSHPLGPSVGLVLNVDARGTSGPSLLFETSADAAGGLSYASHPVTSSLFPMVYERLANGTDFTRFRAKGVLGLNYASLGSSSRYHTSHDDGASFSNASLQDHGDNVALAATRFAGGAAPSADGPRVFFGVLRIGLVAWPTAATVPLAIVSLLMAIGSIYAARRRIRVLRIGIAAVATLLAMAASWGLAMVVVRFVSDAPSSATVGLFATLGVAVSIAIAVVVTRIGRGDEGELAFGSALLFALLAVATSAVAPGAAYLVVVPALLAAAVRFARPPLLLLVPLVATVVLWMPLAVLFFDALVVDSLPVISVIAAVSVLPMMPLLAPRGSGAAVGIVLAAMFALVALTTRSVPSSEFASVAFEQDETSATLSLYASKDTAKVMASGRQLGDERRAAGPFRANRKGYVANVERVSTTGPTLAVLDRKGDSVRVHVTTSPGARLFRLLFSTSAVKRVRFDETHEAVPAPESEGETWRQISLAAPTPEGTDLEIELAGPAPQIVLEEESTDLPPVAASAAKARPANVAAYGAGDVFRVRRSVSLP